VNLRSRVQKLEEELGVVAPDESPGRLLFITFGEGEECDIADVGGYLLDHIHFDRAADESFDEFCQRIRDSLPASGTLRVVLMSRCGPDAEPVPREPPPNVEP